jgi:hypothetical protein
VSVTLLDISDASLTLPEFLVLDASIVLELTPSPIHPHRNHILAVNFLNRLRLSAQHGTVKPILPLLAFEECYFKLCWRFLEPLSKATNMRWQDYYRRNPSVLRSIYPILSQFYQTLLAFPVEITEPEDTAVYPKGREPLLAIRIGDFINRFSVLPKDATILSEAERLGIYTVATLDSDWSRADGFTVFAPV